MPPEAGVLTKQQMHRECVSRVQETSVREKLKYGRGILQRQAKLFELKYASAPSQPDFEACGPNAIDIAVDRLTSGTAHVTHAGLQAHGGRVVALPG